jgi:DNA polymerase (family 10)
MKRKPRATPRSTAVKPGRAITPPLAAPRNEEIARAFDEVADILELESENPFRVRAYRNAARTLRGLSEEVADRMARGAILDELPGIGKDLAAQIAEMVATGQLSRLDRLLPEAPGLALALCRLPGVGPKRAMALYEGLKPQPATLQDVLAACRDGRAHALPGFGARSEKALMERLTADLERPKRFKRTSVVSLAQALLLRLRGEPEVEAADIAGSFRRREDTVGDLDIVVASRAPARVTEHFLAAPEVERVIASGAKRSSVVLKSGVQVDLRIVPRVSYGAALLYFTGGKDHNIELRRRAQAAGLKINEYGVFRGAQRIAGTSEASVYECVGLIYVEPVLRENAGEIEAAGRGDLPCLVSLEDLRGDLHVHTDASDGANSLREMTAAARARGLDYIAVTDHSQRVTIAHGLDPERLRKQIDAVEALNAENPGFTVLKGAEVDILRDGSLDYPDAVLKELDVVVAAVHSDFGLQRDQQTDRILKAIDNKYVNILAHPTGRLLLQREGYDLDMPRLKPAASARGCWLEINSQPERLDLSDTHCRMAKERGVLLSVDSDAHRVGDFVNLTYGVDQARRGWLEAKDIVNTRKLDELRALLRASR